MNEMLDVAIEPNPPYLEHYPDPGGPPQRVLVAPLPFRMGRSRRADCVIYSRQVSSEHSEIYPVGNRFHLRDLKSTNGTFVNGKRVYDVPLNHGDIIHLANTELRFGHEPLAKPEDRQDLVTERSESNVTRSLIRARQHLQEMLSERRARTVFQPVLALATGKIIGYEVLARGDHPKLSTSPSDLLRLASECNLAVELSQMFRSVAIRDAGCLPKRTYLFINLHPSEMGSDTLIDSLVELRNALDKDQRLILEVHEAAVAEPKSLLGLRDQLTKLGIGLAYDDFGAGQSRLKEFADVPPDFIKLDMSLIRGIDHAAARQDLVRALLSFGSDLGVGTIAEGIETNEEAAWCLALGCQYGQGYLFGRPQPLDLLDHGQGRTRRIPKIRAVKTAANRRAPSSPETQFLGRSASSSQIDKSF
jgi:EAL domain-containing protein (putative c-di-GMP-specific phosphodiesterase class I)